MRSFLDAPIIKFEDTFVTAGDALMGEALLLFRRIFTDRRRPAEGACWTERAKCPRPTPPNVRRRRSSVIWARFWELANDPEAARQRGVLGVEFGEPDTRLCMPLCGRRLVQDDETRAALCVSQQPDSCLKSLVPVGQGADLDVALGQLALKRTSWGQDHPVRQVDASRPRAEEKQDPEEPRAESVHEDRSSLDLAVAIPTMGAARLCIRRSGAEAGQEVVIG
jgi:hypothetical protein